MENQFVAYTQALALKELLGFDEPCFCYFDNDKELRTCTGLNNWNNHSGFPYFVSAPLKQQVLRWFREKYDLWFRPDYYDEMREYDYQGSIHQLGRHRSLASLDNCKTVEELEVKCIDKLIMLANDKMP